MTKAILYPFPSQQNKLTGQFILDTCGTCNMFAWLANRIQEELRWACEVVLPGPRTNKHPFKCPVIWTDMPIDNRLIRVNWDIPALQDAFETADIAILNHETLATPLRAIFPKLKIVQQCLVEPRPVELFLSAWQNADLVVVHGEFAKEYLRAKYNVKAESWLMGFDAHKVLPNILKDVDVLFATRSSITNYTHHLEFIAATKLLPNVRVVYADPTNYLQSVDSSPREYVKREDYAKILLRTKVAIFLHSGWFSFALREALAARCTPVVLDHPCFDELLAYNYPYRTDADPRDIADKIKMALAAEGPPQSSLSQESFQAAWPKVKFDLQKMLVCKNYR